VKKIKKFYNVAVTVSFCSNFMFKRFVFVVRIVDFLLLKSSLIL